MTSVRPIASRPGWVSVCVGGRRVGALTVDAAARLGVEPGATWTPAMQRAFEDESTRLDCLLDARRLLRFADHTSSSLAARLVLKGHQSAAIERVVSDLLAESTLDDPSRAVRRAEREAERGKGPLAIESKLRRAGHDRDEASRAARDVVGGDQTARAERFVRHRLEVRHVRPEALSSDQAARERRRLYGLLIRNGFEPEAAVDAIRRVLGDVPDE